MPECREYMASGHILNWGLEAARRDGADLTVRGLVCDDTKEEAKARGRAAAENLAHRFEATSNVYRGQDGEQGSLWPLELGSDSKSLSSLALTGFTVTYRFVVLHLGALNLMLRFLTHTSPNWYPKAVWDSSVMLVDRYVRGFKVGLALIFADRVLAFLSADNVFQPTWMPADQAFDIPPCLCDTPNSFLQNLAAWIEKTYLKSNAAGRGLAMDAIRSTQDIFSGIGAYMVQEIFYLAGIPPFLTAREVFTSPSRTARLVAAFYTYLKDGKDRLVSLLRPAMLEGVLAPTMEQRLQYAYWLYVWAKEQVRVSHRMKAAVDEYHAIFARYADSAEKVKRESLTELCDPFEPSHIQVGLVDLNLGHLAFGRSAWRSDGYKCPTLKKEDPLTTVFRNHGLLSASTNLTTITPLFLPASEFKVAVLPTFAYTGGTGKKIWTVLTDFPPALQKRTFRELDESERHDALFSVRAGTTRNVAIGPLEYCGNGHRVHIANGKHILATCRGDPRIPRDREERIERGVQRRTGTKRANESADAYAAGYLCAAAQSPPLLSVAPAEPETERPPKKRRISANQRILLQAKDGSVQPPNRTRMRRVLQYPRAFLAHAGATSTRFALEMSGTRIRSLLGAPPDALLTRLSRRCARRKRGRFSWLCALMWAVNQNSREVWRAPADVRYICVRGYALLLEASPGMWACLEFRLWFHYIDLLFPQFLVMLIVSRSPDADPRADKSVRVPPLIWPPVTIHQEKF
ncbi:hypothetical protein C8F01DRAFT_1369533 [Mycena amicta]|nr:hypothetical protein C8F01DRAFT_1369533 [Mycena amicta]